jgi:hypothetical protein
MDAKYILLGFCILLLLVTFSGCEEQGATTQASFDHVVFDSGVVDLAFANVTFYEEKEFTDDLEPVPEMVVKNVEVKYLFHNPLDRILNISFLVEFYSDQGELLHRVGPRNINGLLADYTERQFTEVNIANFEGEKARFVSYVKIIAYER